MGDAAGQMTGLTVTGQAASSLNIASGSQLVLGVNNSAGGWVFRWANPTGGNHIADLQSLINAGEVTFAQMNGGSYTLSSDGTYTYVNVVFGVPEPSSLLLLAATGVAVGGWRRLAARGQSKQGPP